MCHGEDWEKKFDEKFTEASLDFLYKGDRDLVKSFIRTAIEEAQKEAEERISKIEQIRCDAVIEKAREEERERVLGIVGEMKTDERKVAVFGSRMDSWEARTYDEKMLVNAALSDLTTKLKEPQFGDKNYTSGHSVDANGNCNKGCC